MSGTSRGNHTCSRQRCCPCASQSLLALRSHRHCCCLHGGSANRSGWHQLQGCPLTAVMACSVRTDVLLVGLIMYPRGFHGKCHLLNQSLLVSTCQDVRPLSTIGNDSLRARPRVSGRIPHSESSESPNCVLATRFVELADCETASS